MKILHAGVIKQRLESIVTQSVRITLVPALDLEVQMGAKERTAIILRALDQYVVPYLDSLSTIERIADYLNSDKPNLAGFTVALRELIHRRKDREKTADN